MSPEYVEVFYESFQEYMYVHFVDFGLKGAVTIPFAEGCAI